MDETFHDAESKWTIYVNVMPVCGLDRSTDLYKIQYFHRTFTGNSQRRTSFRAHEWINRHN
jgi:hypothetical protein